MRVRVRVCVCVLEAGGQAAEVETVECVFAVKSENELNDPRPTQFLTSVCGGGGLLVWAAFTPLLIALQSAFI